MNLKEVVRSKENRPIELFEQKGSQNAKTILIVGVFHGDEPQGEMLIKRFMAENKNNSFKNNLLLLPCLNPDGKELKTRQNANKIDINRNFQTKNRHNINDPQYYGGTKGNSEIETRFMVDILKNYKPDLILSIHAPYAVVNYDGPAKDVAHKISELTGYEVEEYIGYETPGSFGTYAGIERNIPVITLEVEESLNDEELWQKNKPIFEYLAFNYFIE